MAVEVDVMMRDAILDDHSASDDVPLTDSVGAGLVIDNVSKTFVSKRRRFTALSGVNMTLPEGKLTTIVGPSGCGKSTILMILAGLEKPTAGTVTRAGRLVTEPYEGLGIAFQRDLLLPGRTALQNVLLQGELLGWRKEDFVDHALDLLDRVGLAEFARFYPSSLSGGMKQRVALCRALVHHPSVLLLDEPFAAVDALAREDLALQCMKLLDAKDAPTILLVTHSIDEAVLMSDSVYVFSKNPGRVIGNVEIPIPRPRTAKSRQDPRFAQLANTIRDLLEYGPERGFGE